MIPVGTRVGHYVVTELIGTGGMGSVYAATDERLGRKVALKAIRVEHRFDEETRARFLREARILSQLDHPNVCRLYELLEVGDESFLALELIHGRGLRKVLREGLDFGRRLDVARQIAAALVAAHGANVIHRDLKPDNVLLTADGTAKVLDFGIARSLDEEVPGTLAAGEPGDPTHHGADALRTKIGRIVGTAGYMSPEQARSEPTTAASDMYSLGLLLQEIFSGEPPYEKGLTLPMMIERAARGETVPIVELDPNLTALVRRLQSLAPGARPSAVDTLERLTWVRDKPARRRRRMLLTAASIVLVAMSIGLSVLAWRVSREAARANREAERASQSAAAATEVSNFLVGVFTVADPGETRGSTVTARELLDRGAERVRQLNAQPLLQARLMDSMGQAYQQLGLFDEAGNLLAEALAIREKELSADDPEIVESLDHYAYLLRIQGKLDESGVLFARAVASAENRLAPNDPRLATSLNGLGIVRWNEGRFDEAERLYRRSLEIRKQPGIDPKDLASSLDNLAILLKDTRRGAEAEPLFEQALALRERALGPWHPHVARSLNNLGELYREAGRYREAMPLYERAVAIWEKVLGSEHPSVAGTLVNLGMTRAALGDFERAQRDLERALSIIGRTLGPDHEWSGHALGNLGEVAAKRGRLAEAERYTRRAIAVMEKALGAGHPVVAEDLEQLAQVLAAEGKQAEAAATLERVVDLAAARRPPDPRLPELRQRLASLREPVPARR